RFSGAAMAALFAVAQVASFAHSLVRHERCAEHGELVDVPTGSVAGGRWQAADRSARVAAALLGGEGHQHDHCALAAHRRDSSAGSHHAPLLSYAPLA